MVYGMVLVDFCLVKGFLWVYEVRMVWHATRLPGSSLVLIWDEEWCVLYY